MTYYIVLLFLLEFFLGFFFGGGGDTRGNCNLRFQGAQIPSPVRSSASITLPFFFWGGGGGAEILQYLRYFCVKLKYVTIYCSSLCVVLDLCFFFHVNVCHIKGQCQKWHN